MMLTKLDGQLIKTQVNWTNTVDEAAEASATIRMVCSHTPTQMQMHLELRTWPR